MQSLSDDKLLTVPGVMRLLKVNRNTVQEWLLDPALPRLYVGKSQQPRILNSDLQQYLRNRSRNWASYF